MLTQIRLKQLLDYDPETGRFTWRAACGRHGRIPSGTIAGSISRYRYIRLDGKNYPASGLAFLWMTGQRPREVDHINTNKIDDRWSNLRPATRSQNGANQHGRKHRKRKLPKGVHLHIGKRRSKPYVAVVGFQNRRISLGYFRTPEEAYAAYSEAARKYDGEFARF